MKKIAVIPNEEFSSYFPQYTFKEREKYFNPNIRFETHIISFDEKEYKTLTKIGTLIIHSVCFVRGRPLRYFWRLLKTVWIIRKYKIDLVRTYNTFHHGLIAMLAAKVNRKPFVLSLHNDYDGVIRHSGRNYLYWHTLEKIVIKNATVVIGVAPYLSGYAKSHGARHVVVIPNPLNLKPFLTRNENAQIIRSRYNLNGKIVLLFVGRYYDPQKNFSRLLQAFSQLEPRLKQKTHLLVIGKSGGKGVYFNNFVSQLGLKNNVTFIGFLSHSEIPTYYQASDIFVFPSIYEGFGIALVEAMASGLPALTSNHPTMTHLVNSQNGVIINPYNVEEITVGLRYLIQMGEEERKKLGKEGQKKVAMSFNEKKVYDQVEELYLDLLKNGA